MTKNIVGFYIGGQKFYFITGAQNIQTFLRNSPSVGYERFVSCCTASST